MRLELVDVDEHSLGGERVPRPGGPDDVGSERTAELGHVVLQDPQRSGRWPLAPQVVDEAVPSDRLATGDEQVDEQRPLLDAARLHPHTRATHLEGTEDTDAQPVCAILGRPRPHAQTL